MKNEVHVEADAYNTELLPGAFKSMGEPTEFYFPHRPEVDMRVIGRLECAYEVEALESHEEDGVMIIDRARLLGGHIRPKVLINKPIPPKSPLTPSPWRNLEWQPMPLYLAFTLILYGIALLLILLAGLAGWLIWLG